MLDHGDGEGGRLPAARLCARAAQPGRSVAAPGRGWAGWQQASHVIDAALVCTISLGKAQCFSCMHQCASVRSRAHADTLLPWLGTCAAKDVPPRKADGDALSLDGRRRLIRPLPNVEHDVGVQILHR